MYILFAGMDYEECGGAYDIFFTGSLEECRERIDLAVKQMRRYSDDVWWHIYNVQAGKIVEEY